MLSILNPSRHIMIMSDAVLNAEANEVINFISAMNALNHNTPLFSFRFKSEGDSISSFHIVAQDGRIFHNDLYFSDNTLTFDVPDRWSLRGEVTPYIRDLRDAAILLHDTKQVSDIKVNYLIGE